MREFLIRNSVYGLIIIGIYFIVSWFAGGPTQHLYGKFTSGKKHSMIIGTSRALMGFNPNVTDSVLSNGQFGLYNYAFTEIHSSYGEVYYNAILKKLDTLSGNGLFIVAVDPWAISVTKALVDKPDQYPEHKLSVATTRSFTTKPNFSYLKNAYHLSWGRILLEILINEHPERTVHTSGWLEVTERQDSVTLHQRIRDKVKYFRKGKFNHYRVSPNRLEFLEKTIDLLNRYGQVFMVRMPVHPTIKALEDEYSPSFDLQMRELAAKYGIYYLPNCCQGENLVFFDGHHLESTSAITFSAEVGRWIRSRLKRRRLTYGWDKVD